ncbi:hypothetical protein KY329_02965 [Candidatus Woesearchaeota archaeon]|nr:hypothetical protein [Candidatus Woesearchaeota archaeon]
MMKIWPWLLIFALIIIGFALPNSYTGLVTHTSLSPSALVNISTCGNASLLGAVPGDTLTVNVSSIIATRTVCVVLDVVNVTLDCQGNRIAANGSVVGVDLRSNQTEVHNCSFTRFELGAQIVRINGANRTKIDYNRFLNSSIGNAGRVIGTSGTVYNVTIDHNYFNNIDANYLLFFTGINQTFFINNTIRNVFYQFLNRPSKFRLQANQYAQILNNSMNVTCELSSSNNILFRGNTWQDLDSRALLADYCISASASDNITVMDDRLIPMGLQFTSSTNCNISNNTFRNNGRVELLGTGSNMTIAGNVFDRIAIEYGASAGIRVDNTALVDGNIFRNGTMSSILVLGTDSVVRDNFLTNASGDAFIVGGRNNTLINNTVFDFAGDIFRINGSNNKFIRNNVTFVIKTAATSFNRNVSTPHVPIQFSAFLISIGANDTNISSNLVNSQNPLNLLNGLFGVRTRTNTTQNTIWNNSFSNLRMGVWVKDANQTGIALNTFIDCTQRAILVQNSTGLQVNNNNISAPSAPSTDPNEFVVGLYVLRQDSGVFAANNISGYHIGIYLNNAFNNTFTNHIINGTNGIGLYSLYGINNTFVNFNVSNQLVGVKAIYTNGSNFTKVNTSTRTGYMFFNSYNNSIANSTISANVRSIEFTHFSSGNAVNSNTFGAVSDVNILFDLFAAVNLGANNGGPTTREENGAAGNIIT